MFAEIIQNKKEYDSLGYLLLKEINPFIDSIKSVRSSKIFYFKDEIDREFISSLLKDGITDEIYINSFKDIAHDYTIDIGYKRGVMDPEAVTLLQYLQSSEIDPDEVRIIRRFYFKGTKESRPEIIQYMKNTHYNPLIETIDPEIEFSSGNMDQNQWRIKEVDMNCDLMELSDYMTLSLNNEEMNSIKEYFSSKGRNPTDIELETLAQTWSEHCVHKTFKSDIHIEGRDIKNLFKSTIMKATEEIKHSDAISVFHDNAGIWAFDDERCICFKVETHNHPSALEPYGGAGTGIGGVIRDVIGTGLGFKPIANTDVFCVGDNNDDIPEGTIKPYDVLNGVVSGVRDYGNRMGIPTVNGAVHYHDDFAGNPLVYAGSLGIASRKNAFKKVNNGDMIVLIGGKTGRDGIHGATFSSVSLHDQSQEMSSGAVQIGNPIEEKKMLDGIMAADGLYSAITDCGAGGLSSAVGEMGEHTGAEVNLDNVPLKYRGLSYDEIWISESQERMILAVPESNYPKIKHIMEQYNTNISHIGFFKGKKLKITYRNEIVCDMDMEFLHKGVPLPIKQAMPYVSLETGREPDIDIDVDNMAAIVISDPNVASKEWIIRQYDYEVMAQTIVKPMCGVKQDAYSDSAVLMPLNSDRVIVIANGINPHYGRINPSKMTLAVIDEAMRNILVQGGDIEHTAILDNFSWGDVNNNPHSLGALAESAEACRDYAVALGTPFISGKDSLNNYYKMKNKTIEIPHTLLISAVSVTEERFIRNSYFAKKGNSIYLFGKETSDELCGSVLYRNMNCVNEGHMPDTDIEESSGILKLLSHINKMNIISSAHDISDGGLFACLMEMCFASGLSAKISIKTPLKDHIMLFSETQTRIIAEIEPENEEKFIMEAKGNAVRIGSVMSGTELSIAINDNEYKFDIEKFKAMWKGNV